MIRFGKRRIPVVLLILVFPVNCLPAQKTHSDKNEGLYDPGFFFDDDGRVFVAHGYGKIFITELDKTFTPISNDSLVYTGDIREGLEGSHVYKINNYYLYCTYGGVDGII